MPARAEYGKKRIPVCYETVILFFAAMDYENRFLWAGTDFFRKRETFFAARHFPLQGTACPTQFCSSSVDVKVRHYANISPNGEITCHYAAVLTSGGAENRFLPRLTSKV